MNEIDISQKVNKFFWRSIFFVALVACCVSAGIYFYFFRENVIVLDNAKIMGNALQIKTRVDGKILKKFANDGDSIAQGKSVLQLQVKVSPEELAVLEDAVKFAENKFNQEQQLANQFNNAALVKEKDEIKKFEELYKLGAISQNELNQKRAEFSKKVRYQNTGFTRASELQRAKMQFENAQNALKMAKENKNVIEIFSPAAGKIFWLDIADDVKAGQSLAYLEQDEQTSSDNSFFLWVEAYADIAQEKNFYLGQYVEYKLNGKTFEGSIIEIVNPNQIEMKPQKNLDGFQPMQLDKNKIILRIPYLSQENYFVKIGTPVKVIVKKEK